MRERPPRGGGGGRRPPRRPRAPMRPERPRPRGSAPGPMETPPWDPARNDSLPPTLTPAVPPYVKLGLTVVYTVFYALLFVFIYVQLWLVLRYRHKRLSYQSVFLFLCLFWASLRTVLFSFYFKDFVAANSLSPFVFWLLYCFPVCLQFFTLTLMNLYFTQVIFKAKSKYSPELLKYRSFGPYPPPLIPPSLREHGAEHVKTCKPDAALKAPQCRKEECEKDSDGRPNETTVPRDPKGLYQTDTRQGLGKGLVSWTWSGPYLLLPLFQGSSVCQVTAIGVTVILLYTSRACYNLFILSFSQNKSVHSFDYDWYNVSDQADLKNQLGDAGYVLFGVVLFVWELLPTTLVVYFFRVRNPTKDLTNPGMVPSHGFSPRSYFFDNPRRYDSDDDLAWNIAPQGLQGGFAPDYYDWGQQTNSFLAQAGTLQDSTLDPDKPSVG
nr:integral membrane protein GPR137B [Macaca nemestrina]